jgi:hypothetical protein
MKKALISPNEIVYQIINWNLKDTPPTPIYLEIPNSDRLAQIADVAFEVALPMFWIDCDDNVIADVYYYDNSDQTIKLVPEPAPYPTAEDQPITTGSQTL